MAMTTEKYIIRAVALLLILLMICSIAGAVSIQTERIYTSSTDPGSSPAQVGTAAFKNSTTPSLSAPYKTNSWLSPMLWADSKTLIYKNKDDILSGRRDPIYQAPVYPLPWSIYYCKTPPLESRVIFANLNSVDPSEQSESSIRVPQGLFIRPMPIFPLFDTQLQLPDGTYNSQSPDYNIYDLSGTYSAPAIGIDPGFNATNIRVSRMGDYDAGLVLLDTDDQSRTSTGASLSLDSVRGSPFIHLTLNSIQAMNLSIWHGKEFSHSTREVVTGGKNITCEILSTSFKSYGAPGVKLDWDQSSYWDNQTIIFMYPTGSANYIQTEGDPEMRLYGEKTWLFNKTYASFSLTDRSQRSYLAAVTVPSPDFTDTKTLQTLASAAFQYPTGSTVKYSYSPETAEVQATYSLQTSDILGIGGTPVQGLLPLHYGAFFGKTSVLSGTADWVTNGPGTIMVTESVLGEIRYLKGNSFTCTYQYPGILPYIPGLPSQDKDGISNLTKWLNNVEQQLGTDALNPWKYTMMNGGVGVDVYNGGKVIWRAANIYRTAQGIKPSMSSDASSSAARSVSLFFTDNPVLTATSDVHQAPYYSFYDKNALTINLYPGSTNQNWPPNEVPVIQWDGFGANTKLNDHHYTYGYYINAAAEVSLDNATWMQAHKDVINQLVFDVAYDPTLSEKPLFAYPKMRSFDPYTGHCEAGGMTFMDSHGNNDESLSEEMHFWSGVIRWGSASGQSDIETLGIVHYTQTMYAYFTFWHDYFKNNQKLWDEINARTPVKSLWFSQQSVSQIWDGKKKYSTHFGAHPAAITAITALPMTGGSFYHATDKDAIKSLVSDYSAYVKSHNIDPMNPAGTVWQNNASPWVGVLAYYGELACWYALADPDNALSAFFPLNPDTALTPNPSYNNTVPMNQFTEGGKSAAEVYHFIRFLQDYGTPDPLAVHATNTPYYMTFVKSGVRTYVGYNPTDQVMNIAFSDGTLIKNVQPHQFGFTPYGYPGTLKASFTASPLSGTPPLAVSFTDTSSGQITAWSWNFGDGSTSDQQNPQHTFTKEGSYSVSLTVTGVGSKTDTCSNPILVRSSGQLPGNFSISTLHKKQGQEVTTGLSPSLVIRSGISHISFFSADVTSPWQNGVTGNIGYERIDFTQGTPNITKQAEAVPLTYNEYSGHGVPEWGRSSVAIDQSGTPLIAYVNQTSDQPQKLGIAWLDGDSWKVKAGQDVGYGWTPSVAIIKDNGPGFGFASESINGPRYGFQPPSTDYKNASLGIVNIEDPLSGQSVPDTRNLTLLYADNDKSVHAVYYNSAKSEIRHASATNFLTTAGWKKEAVQSGVSAGSLSAAYDTDTNTIGVAWYDQNAKKLMLIEKNLTASSWGSPQAVDTPTDATCSLAYGPAAGVLPGPGISYYDSTTRQLRFAWREGGTWYHVTVDSNGAGTSSSLAYGQGGYPHIAYRHDGQNSLKYAYLNQGTGGEAGFDSDVKSGPAPLTVHFWDTSFNDTVSSSGDDSGPDVEVHYWWDLNEDGKWEFEDVPNPVFTYNETGSYDVKMLLNIRIDLGFWALGNSNLWYIADMSDFINVTRPEPASADFTATPVSGTPPLTVQFTDISPGSPTSWAWNFGDGRGSTEQNPVHTYTGVGRYTVTLETNGPQGSSIGRKPAFITVNGINSRGQSGMLQIRSEPAGADIFIDGVMNGKTPVDELVAKTGSHSLLLHLDGYQNWSAAADVPAGEVRVIPTVRLRRM